MPPGTSIRNRRNKVEILYALRLLEEEKYVFGFSLEWSSTGLIDARFEEENAVQTEHQK